MACNDSFSICSGKTECEVGGICSEICLKVIELEVEVLRLFSKILTCDKYVLNSYVHTKLSHKGVVLSAGCGSEDIGNIYGSKSLDSRIKKSNLSVLDFGSISVNILNTCYAYSHTNLKTKSLNVVIGQAVYIVSACAVSILKEELVTSVTCILGTNESKNTLNYNGRLVCSSNILLVRKNLVLRKNSVKADGGSGVIACFDSSSDGVIYLNGRLLINVDSCFGFTLNNLYFVSGNAFCLNGNGPSNFILNLSDINLSNKLIIAGS